MTDIRFHWREPLNVSVERDAKARDTEARNICTFEYEKGGSFHLYLTDSEAIRLEQALGKVLYG